MISLGDALKRAGLPVRSREDIELDEAERFVARAQVDVEIVGDVASAALAAYSASHGYALTWDVFSPMERVRIVENFIRHRLTRYDDLCRLCPSDVAVMLLRTRVNREIATAYPEIFVLSGREAA